MTKRIIPYYAESVNKKSLSVFVRRNFFADSKTYKNYNFLMF